MKRVEKIKSYYEKNMGKGLPDHSILGWESEEAQRLRFDALALNLPLSGMKILDVGCGVGNFYEYLQKKDIKVEYTGTDILGSMISYAKSKNPEAKFFNCDIFKNNPFEGEKFDVVYSSGIFNLNLENNIEFLCKAVTNFLKLSKGIVAFNLLSKNSQDKEDKYYYYDSGEIGKMIEERFFGEIEGVKLINGYLQNDFTVICYKKDF